MKKLIVPIICGLLFGAGLVLSDMVNPARVLGFLDVAGPWDPTLAFVMGGALIPSSLAYALRRRMARPWLTTQFRIPSSRLIDTRLVLGAALFGVGWGLVGLCPGPAIAMLGVAPRRAILFVAAMIAGMAIFRFTTGTWRRVPAKQQEAG